MDGRWRRPNSAFRRVVSPSSPPNLLPTVRAALDTIGGVRFGQTLLWQVDATVRSRHVPRVWLQLWRPVPGLPEGSTTGLNPILQADSLQQVRPSPFATPSWLSLAVWRLPVVGDMNQVVFTTRNGSQWLDSWSGYPIFLRKPATINWTDVVDVDIADPRGVLHSELAGLMYPSLTFCPFSVPPDDPLLSTLELS